MAQVLIRNLEDEILDDYRQAAKRNSRSLEAELREALRRMRPKNVEMRDELIELSRRLRLMTPPGAVQTPAEQLIREDRDGYRDA
jgi:plasmid stability protein